MKIRLFRLCTALVLTLSVLLGMCPLLPVATAADIAATPSPTAVMQKQVYRDGDVNGDGSVDTADVRYLLSLLVRNEGMSDDLFAAADANNDYDANTADAKYILTRSMTTEAFNATTVDLLAPTANDWCNPIIMCSGSNALVEETALSSGGYTFKNTSEGGFTWPYAVYVYDDKLLIPDDAVIEYDLTVGGASTSLNLYLGGAVPDLDGDAVHDDVAGRSYVKLNSFISSKNIDAGSGDLTSGTYKGTIRVSDLGISDADRVAGMMWLSAIKVYSVGNNNTTLTIRKLKVTAYRDAYEGDYATDDYNRIRPGLMSTTETEGLSTVTSLELFVNGKRSTDSSISTANDNKKIYNTVTAQRIVNYADGYQIDVPFDWKEDYSLSALRSRYTSKHYSLTVTRETKNPYSGASGWQTYLDEWLIRYIGDSTYLKNNGLTYTRTPVNSTSLLDGYTVMTYDIAFNDHTGIDYPYYSIVIIRKTSSYNTFYLMVLKSDAPTASVADRLIRSFKEVARRGTAINVQGQYDVKKPSYWNAETSAYYDKLLTQTETDFGFFTHSMVPKSDSTYSTQYSRIRTEYERFTSTMDMEYGIMPTYTHLKYGSTYHQFPTDMAKAFAGGNGFNGKPVLQFTYQFTTNNNVTLNSANPIFEILRGNHDAQFRRLAKDIKAYGKPVLFRLNNEMNTDWTSYCGMTTLLDPDFFIQSWQRLYDIFEEEGVDNCIWIFNPVATTTPYCSWGEDLCYMPGADYMQVFGLTNYEMGNGSSLKSFQKLYTDVYNKSEPNFGNFPWIISEFAAGAGGERQYDWTTDEWNTTTLGRNADKQAQWVTEMFNCLNNKDDDANAFARNIVGAVWFSCNDYTTINSKSYIVNYLAVDSTSTATVEAFRNGFNPTT